MQEDLTENVHTADALQYVKADGRTSVPLCNLVSSLRDLAERSQEDIYLQATEYLAKHRSSVEAQVEKLIEVLGEFRSTVDGPAPSTSMEYVRLHQFFITDILDVAAVFAGTKPAAIASLRYLQQSPHGLVLLERCSNEGLIQHQHMGISATVSLYVSKDPTFAEQAIRAEERMPGDKDADIALGQLLGYHPDAIQSFIGPDHWKVMARFTNDSRAFFNLPHYHPDEEIW